jgi:transcriptional regulator with XRE-family HTH domain
MNSTQEIREAFGLTQQELAVFLGVSRSLISMAEGGRAHLPTAALLQLGRLAACFYERGRQPVSINAKEAAAMNATLKKHAQECSLQALKAKNKLDRLQQEYEQCTTALAGLDNLLATAMYPSVQLHLLRVSVQH